MALYLVLEDYSDGSATIAAGSLLDDGAVDLARLQSAGLAAVLYNASTMSASREAFIAARGSRPVAPDSSGDLSALLLAAGAIGGSGGGVASVAGSAPITSSGGANPTIGIAAATPLAAGSMSAADKAKLDGITTIVTSVTASGPLASSGGTTPDVSLTAGTTPGDVLTWDGASWAGAAPTGGGTISGTIAANEVAFGTAADTIGGSANLTWNAGTSALSIIGDAFDCLTVASVIDGQFLAVSPTAYTLVITDPLTPTSSATMGPGDVAVGDGIASGNVQAGFVGVTENATGNRLTLTAPAGLGTLTSEDSATNAPVALNVVCEELQVNGAPGAAGEVLTSNGPGAAPTWQAGGGGGGAVFAGALTVYVDPVNGTDAPGGGTLGAPFASINYAYSQVPSLGDPLNVSYNANVGQFVTEKLVIQLAPGRYTENVVLGFRRGRVQLVGNGVQIIGSVTMRALRADFPAANMESIKASFPAPYTGAGTLATFEITGSCGGGVESDATADPFVVTGLTTLLFDEPTFAGAGLAPNWDSNYGQFNFYANKAYLLGGMVIATSYTVPTTNGLPVSVMEIDSCTIGESGVTYRSYLGGVPLAYASNPTTWNKGTGVATGAQSSTTLQDTTKAWTVDEFAGATVVITSGTGAGQSRTVISNTATTLTVAAWATTPVAASSVYSLVGTTNKAPTGTITLKAHNSTIGASIGPRLTLGELDGCRVYDIDRTMLGTVDNGGVTGSTSTSYLGLVINQFRQFSGTGFPPSQYQLGSALSGARHKIDSTSYTTLGFNRNSSGVLSARTLNLPTSSGTATAGAGTTLTDTTKTWNASQWVGGTLTLTGGSGSGQSRTITANTATQITVSPAFSPAPAAGTTYTVTALVAFDLQDDARSLAYTPTTGAQWLDPDPTTVGAALDKVGGLGLLAAAPTNGQIPIGNGTNYTPATLTAGAGIAITNGAGAVTVATNQGTIDIPVALNGQHSNPSPIDVGAFYFSTSRTVGTSSTALLLLTGGVGPWQGQVTLTTLAGVTVATFNTGSQVTSGYYSATLTPATPVVIPAGWYRVTLANIGSGTANALGLFLSAV